MARLNVKDARTIGSMKQHLGKILLFCEGETEYNYFNYFARIIDRNRIKYAHVQIEFVRAGGNAQAVLNRANEFFEEGDNASKYINYEKYLVFDCDAPANIQQVIKDMDESLYEFNLLLTNYLFELWLLMHFQIVNEPLDKREIIRKFRQELGVSRYTSKQKSSEGTIRKVIGNGENVKNAIANAKELEGIYETKGYSITEDISKLNPYTSVHKLIEKILMEI